MNYLKKALLLVMALTLFNSPLWCMEGEERSAESQDLLNIKLAGTEIALRLSLPLNLLRNLPVAFFRDFCSTIKPIDITKIPSTMLVNTGLSRQCIEERGKQFNLSLPKDINNCITDIVSSLIVQDTFEYTLECNFEVTGQLDYSTKYVNAVAFSPNGKIVVTISEDSEASLWAAENGAFIQRLRGHSAALRSVAFSPNSEIVAIGSDDTTVSLWEVKTGTCRGYLTGSSSSISSIAFNHDGTKVLAGSNDNVAYLWDAKTGVLIRTLKHSGPVSSVAFSPVDSTKVLIGSWDGKAYLWDIETGTLRASLLKHSDKIHSAAFSPDGEIIVTVSDDKTACVWDGKTGKFLQQLSGYSGALKSVVFSPDSNIFVTVSDDKTACVWDAKTRTLIKQLTDISSVAFNPDSKTIVTVLANGAVCFWNAKTGELILKHIKLSPNTTRPLVAFSPDGKTIFIITFCGKSNILKKKPCKAISWILSKATFFQRLLIIIAAERNSTDNGCIIAKNTIEYSIFKEMPDYVQKCLIEWYSINTD